MMTSDLRTQNDAESSQCSRKVSFTQVTMPPNARQASCQWYYSSLRVWHWAQYDEQSLALILTKTGSQTPHLQSQRNAQAGPSLRNLQSIIHPYSKPGHARNQYLYTVVIHFTWIQLGRQLLCHKQMGLPGVRLMASVLIRCDGWLSTSSNMGRPPLQQDNCRRRKSAIWQKGSQK